MVLTTVWITRDLRRLPAFLLAKLCMHITLTIVLLQSFACGGLMLKEKSDSPKPYSTVTDEDFEVDIARADATATLQIALEAGMRIEINQQGTDATTVHGTVNRTSLLAL